MTNKKILRSYNPSNNYQLLGSIPTSSRKNIQKKILHAKNAFPHWKLRSTQERVQILKKLEIEIRIHKEDLAALSAQEMGMPITQARQDVDSALDFFAWYLQNVPKYLLPETSHVDNEGINTVYFEPLGVAFVITPWNFPTSNFVWGVIPNLLVGNTVVFKHSSKIPLFGKFLETIIHASHLPTGICNEVYGGEEAANIVMSEKINLLWFSGSSKIGKHLYTVAANKFIKVVLELGGSAPGIVFEDADIDKTVETIYYKRFINCGQVCDGLKRLIVHKSVYNEIINKLLQLLHSKKLGIATNNSTDIGPLSSKNQLQLLIHQYNDALDKKATVLLGGKKPAGLKGAFFEPTILVNISKNMKVWQEEVFGPILPIMSFTSEDEAIQLANTTAYGLGAYLFTRDKQKALRVSSQIDSGMININGCDYLHPSSPFGGYKESGIGREHGKYGIRELTQTKVVALEKNKNLFQHLIKA